MDANIDFNVKENDIVPFISLGFDKFHNNLISEVICGPNNMIRKSDLDMFYASMAIVIVNIENQALHIL